MIRWTSAGAVEEPSVVQVRVGVGHSRVSAGAPEPSRPMTAAEVEANVRHFTVDRRGPRSAPCAGLVLSGLDAGPGEPEGPAGDELARILMRARGEGIERVVLHLGRGGVDPALGAAADIWVARIERAEDADPRGWLPAAASAPSTERHAVVVLTSAALAEIDAITDALAPRRGQPSPWTRVVYTWPLSGADVPPAVDAAAAIRGPLQRLAAAGIAAGVKGIPLCTLAPGPSALEAWEERVWRSTNRFYVDADHQREGALMFFPDVVRFTKADSCRFCAAVGRCDGVVETWLRRGLAGPLVPLG